MLTRHLAAFATCTLLCQAPLAATAAPTAPRDRLLISPAWLSAHLADRDLVLLHVGAKPEYDKAHIPGARYLDVFGALGADGPNGLDLELPPVDQLNKAVAALGVTSRSRIVLYFGTDWVSPTTRAWYTFQYLGLGDRTVLLDGGLPAWTAKGLAVSAEVPPPAAVATGLSLTAHPAIVVDADYVRSRLGRRHFRIIDARDPEFYRGLDAGSGTRPGHLPGAKSLPFTTVTDDSGQFLADKALWKLFAAAGAGAGDEVVVYCHIGQQGTAVVFAAHLLGLNARLYDGSYEDWTRHEDYAVEGGIPPTQGGLISTEELAQRLAHDTLTVIDLRSDFNAYLANHLPGAIYLHYETLRLVEQGIPAATLPLAEYTAIWSRLGLRRDRPVVIYGSGDAQNFNATFLAWLLAGFRHPTVYVLDGGYGKWAAESRPLTRLYPEGVTTQYVAEARLDLMEGIHIQHALGRPWLTLVDVRPADQYAGTAGAQLRRGHIPGAINHFWGDDLQGTAGNKTWKSVEALRAAYVAQGITPDKRIVIYCNTGTEASHVYFALHEILHYPEVKVYIPSWTEWSENTELPIEGPDAVAAKPAGSEIHSCSDH
ncbi:MAG: rhodanese-like domain-containing protein [Gemmatimonadales bacterium]